MCVCVWIYIYIYYIYNIYIYLVFPSGSSGKEPSLPMQEMQEM